jgi:hypothetical protein
MNSLDEESAMVTNSKLSRINGTTVLLRDPDESHVESRRPAVKYARCLNA